jgi:hypothetical protein
MTSVGNDQCEIMQRMARRHRNWMLHPWRSIRRWWRTTPGNAAAQTMLGVGGLLIIVAAVVYLLARNYG